MKNILYIITNISMPNICKVGITNNIEQRLKSLNRTSIPTRFQVYEKFEIENAEVLEQEIFQHFAKKRINRKREFFQEHPERICDFIEDNKKIKKEEDKKISGKFKKLDIREGEILRFKEGDEIYPNIIAKVGSGNSIIYKEKETSLSKSAQIILKEKFNKNWKAVQGTIFWTHKGKTIRELMDEKGI